MIDLVERLQKQDKTLSISGMCDTLSLSRATLYRCESSIELDDNTDLRDAIQRIALKMPCYGYRRITKQLYRQGYQVNHKRVLRLMREDNLLCFRKKSFAVTTDSNHSLAVYPNLARDMLVDGINQLWVSDITYVRLRKEFIYLAVVLDVFSRRCIGWNLGRRLDANLAIDALDMALAGREILPGLVHHSDRGVQYASREYTDRLKDNGIIISMSRPGNPYDNAYAESFMKTLKYEEVYLCEYDSLADAHYSIEHFIEEVYNLDRLHSAIGYLPPVEFEQQITNQKLALYPELVVSF